jgi:hypothetical protein
MSDLRVDETSFAGATFPDSATSPVANFSRMQRSPISAGLLIGTGLIATLAWMAFLGWAAGKIVGLW